MSEAFRRCSLSVCRAQLPASSEAEHEPAEGCLYFGGYELLLHQDLNDGLYHELEESGATLRLQVGKYQMASSAWPAG